MKGTFALILILFKVDLLSAQESGADQIRLNVSFELVIAISGLADGGPYGVEPEDPLTSDP